MNDTHIRLLNIDYLIAKKWSGQNRTSQTGSAAPDSLSKGNTCRDSNNFTVLIIRNLEKYDFWIIGSARATRNRKLTVLIINQEGMLQFPMDSTNT